MKKKIIFGLFSIFAFFSFTFSVYAGNVTINFSGPDSVTVNNNIEIIVRASDISGLNDGLATAQGDISFDENYLEYVKYEDVSSLSVSYGSRTKRFVALGLSGEFIANNDNLIKLTFKAKNVGTTTISVNNIVVGDTKSIIHGSNVVNKTINIVGASNNENNNNNSTSNNNTQTTTPSSSTTTKTYHKKNSSTKKNNNSVKSSDASLSKILISNAKVSPSFNKNTFEYNVEIPNDMNKLTLDYEATDKNASVKVIGNENFQNDVDNIVEIIVTASDGSTKTYTLKVKKSNNKVDNKLKKLTIKESKIDFDEDVLEYNITVDRKVKKLTINAVPKNSDTKIEIIGNKLEIGNNVVLIQLTDKNGFQTYYKINVKRDNTFKIFGISIKYIFYFIELLLLLLIIIFIIIIIKRKKRKKRKQKKQEKDDVYVVNKADLEEIRNHKPTLKSEEDNVDIYDDVVTKNELIDAIEERNPKKLKMLLMQEKANKLKQELIDDEENE